MSDFQFPNKHVTCPVCEASAFVHRTVSAYCPKCGVYMSQPKVRGVDVNLERGFTIVSLSCGHAMSQTVPPELGDEVMCLPCAALAAQQPPDPCGLPPLGAAQ